MKYVRGSNWVIAGILAAACFAGLVLLINMSIPLAGGLSAVLFAGAVMLFMPSKYIVGGIDITTVHNKRDTERDILKWQEQAETLRRLGGAAGSAYLTIKIAQMIDIADLVFSAVTNDVSCLPCARRFFGRLLDQCLSLAERYRQADGIADKTGAQSDQNRRESLRVEIENLVEYFQNNVSRILSGDGKELAHALDLMIKAGEAR